MKKGSYFTFPEALVDGSGDTFYMVYLQFVRETTAGDEFLLPDPLPAGWVKKVKSTPTACFIEIASGATDLQVQTFLRGLNVKLGAGNEGNQVMVTLSSDNQYVSGSEIYYFWETDHWYEYVAGMHPWWEAYNEALSKYFVGASGYLATITSAEENNFVYNVSSGKMAWLGGTRGDLSTVATDGPELSGAPTDHYDYWYWACGNEYSGDPFWSAFYKKKKYSDPDPNPDPWETWGGLPYDYNAWGTNQPDNMNGSEAYLHIGSYNNSSWNDYGVNGYQANGSSGKKIEGFMVEYDNYLYMRTSNAVVGYESTKKASIDGVYNNGTATNPVKVVYGDEILYEIKAVNSSLGSMHYVSILDTIPDGLELVPESISDEGSEHYDSSEDRYYITWYLDVPFEGGKVVSYKATPVSKTTKTMKNTALVTSDEMIPTRAAQAPPTSPPYMYQTDTTYHIGTVCKVTFDSEPGGSVSGGTNPQILNYGDSPESGVTPVPDKPERKFVGWSYPAYVSVKGENISAGIGIQDYTKVKVYDEDMTLTARWNFEFEHDTVVSCEPPLKLESGHDGLSYEWILPDGSKQTTEDIQAQISGKYYLHTNYGSITTVDSVVVLFAFDADFKIEDLSPAGSKMDRPQIYTVPVDTTLKNVTYQWSFSGGGDPATSTADTATVVFKAIGAKTVTVTVTIEMPGSITLTCSKTLTLDVMIYGENRNFFVDRNVVGGRHDGSSWANAYRRVEDALDKATSGDFIWVARGAYAPPTNSAYMLNHDSIEIYGGFGAWETSLDQRDYGKNHTILRGSGTSVIVNTKADSSSRWDGFIIEGGNAEKGGGIFNNQSSATIANCVIRSNQAVEGGGIYTHQGSPVLYNLEISGNTAQVGGGMYTEYGNPQIINLTISGNRATIDGGGLYNDNANPVIYNSIIWGNRSVGNSVIVNSASMPFFTYTLIERYGDDDPWNTSFGINGGHNIGSSPLFKRAGFDDKGNMQIGNYRLSVSSPCVNSGLNRYLEGVPVRSFTNLEDLSGTVYLPKIPFDVQNRERVEFDRVDRGAYEYALNLAMPTITRRVYLPDVEGLVLDREPGEHFVETQNNFVFTIAAKAGYNLDDLTVETGNAEFDAERLKMVWNEDGTVTVTLVKVMETILVTINGNTPILSGEVANNNIDNGQSVWSYMNNLHINTDKRTDIQIYTMAGQLYLQRIVDAGDTVIQLRQGLYIVQMNGQTYKVVIKK